MIKINIHEAKTNLSSLLLQVEKHSEIVRICRNNVAIAELRPLTKKPRKLSPPRRLKAKLLADPLEPLADADWGDLKA